MTALGKLLARLGAASRRNRLDAQPREEIDEHIELRRQQLILVGLGLAVGIPAAIGGSRFVSSLLFEISPSSPLALTAAAGIMLAVSLLAAFIPAQRASRVDPAIALRAE